MADEITYSIRLHSALNGTTHEFNSTNLTEDKATNRDAWVRVSVTTSASSMEVGAVDLSGGPAMFRYKNHGTDPTSIVKVRSGSGGADLIHVPPGGEGICVLSEASDPYLIADATTEFEYLIMAL